MPSTLVRLDPAGYRRTPWKNGGGVTIDIADEYAPGAVPGGWEGVRWRFGRTTIERPAPFSDLSGLDRILTVIRGRGLTLRVADGRVLDAREPFRPLRFDGGWPVESRLDDGPVEVLNLMADRATCHADVAIARGGDVALPPGSAILHAPLEPVQLAIDGEAMTLAPDEAVLSRGPAIRSLAHRDGRLAIATIRPR